MPSRPLNIPAFLAQTPQPVIGPTTLSGRRYILRLYWGPNAGWGAGAWLLDLLSASGEVLVSATQLVLTSDLWACFKSDTRVPPGRLEVTRVSGSGDPGPFDLGVSVVLKYVD